jgi:lysophospholipase L1-like esterase
VTRAERPRLAAALALALVGVLAGCSETPDRAASPTGPEIGTYVALGDSFTAAPLVPGTDIADGCFRSSGNYPSLVAEELDAKLRDVSCSGAATADFAGRQVMAFGSSQGDSVPPQLRAVRRGTDLVTVGIGGNDESLFQTLVHRCTAVAGRPGSPCTELLRKSYGDPTSVLDVVGRRVTGVLDSVREQAPDATVVLVGYPRLVDEDRSCEAMPVAEGDLALVAELEEELSQALAEAAETAGVEYLDMYSVSEGHEVCSDDPWVNGRFTQQQAALAFHPFAEGQQAVADELLALLDTSP